MSNRLTRGEALVGRLVSTDDVVVGDDLIVAGSVTFGDQQAFIADPTGGATIDAEARTSIAAIIDALAAVGIISPTA